MCLYLKEARTFITVSDRRFICATRFSFVSLSALFVSPSPYSLFLTVLLGSLFPSCFATRYLLFQQNLPGVFCGGGVVVNASVFLCFYSNFKLLQLSPDTYLDILGITPQTSHLQGEHTITELLPTPKHILWFLTRVLLICPSQFRAYLPAKMGLKSSSSGSAVA